MASVKSPSATGAGTYERRERSRRRAVMGPAGAARDVAEADGAGPPPRPGPPPGPPPGPSE